MVSMAHLKQQSDVYSSREVDNSYIYMEVSSMKVTPSSHPLFYTIFHHKPSSYSIGVPHLWNSPYILCITVVYYPMT